VGLAQLLARVEPAALAPQPFAVEEIGAGQFDADAGTAEAFDGLAIEPFCDRAVGEERSTASLDPEPPVVPAGAGHLRQSLEGIAGRLSVPGPGRRLDELGQSPEDVLGRGRDGARNGVLRRVIAAETVVEHSTRPFNGAQREPLAASNHLVSGGLDQLGNLRHVAAPGGERQGTVEREVTPARVGERLCLLDLGSHPGESARQSRATAKTHVSRAMVKLHARDRAQLVVCPLSRGVRSSEASSPRPAGSEVLIPRG
jgi:hypothetical protein